MTPLVVCLLPVRNGERDLPGFLDAAAGVCDSVVALDDGSTDATSDILHASPRVDVVLRSPRRTTYAGWDDAANRARLLRAADDLAPRWVLWLDADERIDADDAAVLREFLARDAMPGCAFGLQHFRMWGEDRYDPSFTWIYRLFAHRPGQRLPTDRLHFDPVPTDIPRTAWLRTTIRVKHLGSADEERRVARTVKYREADPAGAWPQDYGGLFARPEAELPIWEPRPASLPALMPRNVPAPAARGAPPTGQARVVCLLPARNCAHDLPGFFQAVRGLADAVVALDDGSTDDTREVLEREPLVEVLLTNPVRETYDGWDDAANRNRLLAAAGALAPDWILSLDADERLHAGDAEALRRFVQSGDAQPGFAYGLRVFTMMEDGEHFDAGRLEDTPLTVYRLFAHEPGQRFPPRRLHLQAVPVSIPPSRWIETTLRIQHLGAATEERRRRRFAKYSEADPDLEFQASYDNLLTPPRDIARYEPRDPGLPVVGHYEEALERLLAEADLDGPVISAIVISRDDEAVIERVVGAVVRQQLDEPFEVIVVTSGTDRTAQIVRERFPHVTLVELGHPALPGEARNAGLRVARGDYVTFPGSHIELPQGSLAARVRAHESGFPLVTASTLCGTRTPAGWAAYFLDHALVLPGRPSGVVDGPPGQCSYLRDLLIDRGGFPEDLRAGEDTVVNMDLTSRGYRTLRCREVTQVHRSPCRTPGILVRHHFKRGRGLGRIMCDGAPRGRPAPRTLVDHAIRYVPVRLGRTVRAVWTWGSRAERARFAAVSPLVVAGIAAAWAGSWYEIARTVPAALRRAAARPTRVGSRP